MDPKNTDREESVDQVDGSFISCIKPETKKKDVDDSEDNFEEALIENKYAQFYDMNYPHNGYLLIFAHSDFTFGKLESRDAVEEDILMLTETFNRLNFHVHTCRNFTLQKIRKCIRQVATMKFINFASVAVAVSSHGNLDFIAAADQVYIPDEELIEPFLDNETLFGKPKMFFLGPCRGDKTDSGVTLYHDGSFLDGHITIPRASDVLIVYSTVKDHIAFHNEVSGSQFFIYLTRALNEFGYKMDLIGILTLANQRLSIDFASHNEKDRDYHNKKQCMCIVTTTMKKIQFKI